MLDKLLVSFKDNISRNTRNPFFGTLILVWCIRNWKIVYAIFFDNRKFTEKLKFIEDQLSASTPWEVVLQFAINTGLALAALIIIYILLYLTRYITNRFENQLLPWIYKKSAPKKIVLKEEYEKVDQEKKNLEERLEKEREKRIKAEAEVQRLEEKEINKLSNIEQPLFPEQDESTPDTNLTEVERDNESFKSDVTKILDEFDESKIKNVFDAVLNGYEFKTSDENFNLIKALTRKGFLEFIDKDYKAGAYLRTYGITRKGEDFIRSYF